MTSVVPDLNQSTCKPFLHNPNNAFIGTGYPGTVSWGCTGPLQGVSSKCTSGNLRGKSPSPVISRDCLHPRGSDPWTWREHATKTKTFIT